MEVALVVLLGILLGGAAAAWLAPRRLAQAPEALVRVNVSGARVPAVLGEALVGGGVLALAVVGAAGVLGWGAADPGRPGGAVALVAVGLFVAGRYDDLRGDEEARGFRGHLSAGRMTGGIAKIVAGGISGLAAGTLVAGRFDPGFVVETAVLVALTANLVNLLDRAPGRAAKGWLLLSVPLLMFGAPAWSVAAAGIFGASLVCLPPDLAEIGMLGDAGANPLGAVAGLGLAVSFDRPARLAMMAVLLVLNAASERVSFSRVVEKTPWLRAIDRIGRK